ncbi:hypothetical protein [Muribaculum intestinale]|uniref:hypothetical protein n=1 Tax=Muribaculum intestinale TaxID=1796646 RepID=UPI0025A9A7CB|nr:hypothetical protein [Muribaculum intestinale]
MLFKLRRRIWNRNTESIDTPRLITNLIDSIPNIPIEIIDYYYKGDMTSSVIANYVTQLYGIFDEECDLVLIEYTRQQNDSRLLRKMYKSSLNSIPFSTKTISECKMVNYMAGKYHNLIFFTDIQRIKTFDDLTFAVEELFTGVLMPKYFLLYSRCKLSDSTISSWLSKSLWLNIDRHGYPRDITVSLESLYCCKGNCRVLYPYGGSDWGKLLLFEF